MTELARIIFSHKAPLYVRFPFHKDFRIKEHLLVGFESPQELDLATSELTDLLSNHGIRFVANRGRVVHGRISPTSPNGSKIFRELLAHLNEKGKPSGLKDTTTLILHRADFQAQQ